VFLSALSKLLVSLIPSFTGGNLTSKLFLLLFNLIYIVESLKLLIAVLPLFSDMLATCLYCPSAAFISKIYIQKQYVRLLPLPLSNSCVKGYSLC